MLVADIHHYVTEIYKAKSMAEGKEYVREFKGSCENVHG